ncbi:MAG: HD domain-containing protein [Bdellovibrionales bacterium]|nr:HD domain-containing protein [Bdellovibrionales bacterium]
MAARTFLTEQDKKQAMAVLQPPLTPPQGKVRLDHAFSSLDFSSWLGLNVEKRLRSIPEWEAAGPIAIGSWGRGELSPCSDLDVIFCGDEEAVKKVMLPVEELGLKFRSRVPENMEDWTQNIDVLEANALFWAKPFTQEAAKLLQEQKDKILKNQKKFRQDLLKAIGVERKKRFKRYDSIANFLEPNLKFGSGGLRDLHQALILRHWFPEKFSYDEHAFEVLEYYKSFFLLIRQKLHLQTGQDIMTGSEQPELAHWFGFAKNLDFMREVQKGLSRVSFHSDWVHERCRTSQKKIKTLGEIKLSGWNDALKLLESDPSLHHQAIVRNQLYDSKGFRKEKFSSLRLGKLLRKAMVVEASDDWTVALFRSHVVSHSIPGFLPIIGLVQHDQYHRYSVDAHLMQAVREVKRIYEHPKLLGKMEFYCEKLNSKDWEILRWAALYHDIAKGSGGAHASKGRQMVLKDFKAFGFAKSFTDEVAWIVDNHLLLSTAAFRKNPQSPKTWQELFSRGVRGQRLYRLAIFTAIDILATNPEAWTSWKESLLSDLVDTLRNPSSERYFDLVERVRKEKMKVPIEFIEHLDLAVVDSIPQKVLLKDFQEILAKKELPPLVMRDKKNQIWVRFHENRDQKGLVLQYTQALTSLGCNIRQAFIHTNKKMGVYDWFCIKTNKSISILKKQLKHNTSPGQFTRVSFSQIQLMDQDDKEWVLSFRAKDKKGLLVSAIQSLYDHDLEIVWAKVHTWGRQIDDIFGVQPLSDKSAEQILKSLKDQLETKELQML